MKTSQHSLKKEIPNFKKWEKDLKHLIKDNKQLSKGTSHQYVHHNKILQKCKLQLQKKRMSMIKKTNSIRGCGGTGNVIPADNNVK